MFGNNFDDGSLVNGPQIDPQSAIIVDNWSVTSRSPENFVCCWSVHFVPHRSDTGRLFICHCSLIVSFSSLTTQPLSAQWLKLVGHWLLID